MSVFAKAPEMKDVCFEISKTYFISGDRVVLKGCWWNVAHGGPPQPLNCFESLKLPRKSLMRWKLTEQPEERKIDAFITRIVEKSD